jgi:hypothetical protein
MIKELQLFAPTVSQFPQVGPAGYQNRYLRNGAPSQSNTERVAAKLRRRSPLQQHPFEQAEK